MPWAKLLATNRPSADDSRAARHMAQPWPRAEDSNTAISPKDEMTVNTFRISADPNEMCRVAESLRARDREQYHRKHKWDERQQYQIETLVAQMHKNCGNDQDLCECRAHKKQSFKPFVKRRVTQSQCQQAEN